MGGVAPGKRPVQSPRQPTGRSGEGENCGEPMGAAVSAARPNAQATKSRSTKVRMTDVQHGRSAHRFNVFESRAQRLWRDELRESPSEMTTVRFFLTRNH
jgi:hypothetical protein